MADVIDLGQVATSGAAALVAGMATTGWDSCRAAIARLLGRGGREPVERELRIIDDTRTRFLGCAEEEREVGRSQAQQTLFVQLMAFLQKYPEAAAELGEFADGRAGGAAAPSIGVQYNRDSQIVIAAGPVRVDGGMGNRIPGGTS
ncbi:hypothetical protein [Kitasatospora sp. NPDC088134]|uniref:hypothetical protein n=1 Tax=Kitasatospora sp. NPDC088134 TaxID=3364071 RepID=UPI00382AAB6C